MNFQENEKQKIIFALNLLNGIDVNGYKFCSINIKDDLIVFSTGEKDENISIKKILESTPNELVGGFDENTQFLTETSDVIKNIREDQLKNENTELSKISLMANKIGGGKNVFNEAKYSDTSSFKITDTSNYSKTSSVLFNNRSDNYSDTSEIGQIGGNGYRNGNRNGNGNLTTDTLMDLSELKQRKHSSKSTYLDMGIFKKVQSGGSTDSIKKKMMDIGINSNSSTSSICE